MATELHTKRMFLRVRIFIDKGVTREPNPAPTGTTPRRNANITEVSALGPKY